MSEKSEKRSRDPIMLPPGSIIYTVVITKETKPALNDFTPARTEYSAALLHGTSLVNGTSGGLSPMIAKSLDKETRKVREMEVYGQVIATLAKIIIADSADRIVG
jgi:hypothetical protein